MSRFMEGGGAALLSMIAVVSGFLFWIHSPIGLVGTRAFEGVWVRDPRACQGPLPSDAIQIGPDLWFPWAGEATGAPFLFDPHALAGRDPAESLAEVDSVSFELRPGEEGRLWRVRFAYDVSNDRLTPVDAGPISRARFQASRTNWLPLSEARAADPRIDQIAGDSTPYLRCASAAG